MGRLSNEGTEQFCRLYVASHDSREAAAGAGLAEAYGRRLLQNTEVQARIRELSEKRLTLSDITADRVMLELGRLATSDVRTAYDENGNLKHPHQLDDDTAASISEIKQERRRVRNGFEVDLVTGKRVPKYDDIETVRVKRYDKNAALSVLAKHFKIVGDEGDGVNALASALADRLKSARQRTEETANEGEQGQDV